MTANEQYAPIPEAPTLTIPWPTVRPTGITVTAGGLKDAWDAIVPAFGGNGGPQSMEERIVMGVLRAVYDGMHGITRDDSDRGGRAGGSAAIDLDALAATAKAATPGPWEDSVDDLTNDVNVYHDQEQRLWVAQTGTEPGEQERANAEFIAAADPATVLALIERVRAAEEALAEAHAHFAIQEGRIRQANARAERLEAAVRRIIDYEKGTSA